MSLPTNFTGKTPSLTSIKSSRFILVVIDQSNYVRGQLNTGAQILNLGITNDIVIDITDGLTSTTNFGAKFSIAHDAKLTAKNITAFNLTEIRDLKDNAVTLAILKSEDVVGLTGFSEATTWAAVQGAVSAVAVFQNVFIDIALKSVNAEFNTMDLVIDTKAIKTGYATTFSDYDPIGTPTNLWDFTATSSLSDSIRGIVLTAQGHTYNVDHYDVTANANDGFINTANENNFDITSTTKYLYAFIDVTLSSAPGSIQRILAKHPAATSVNGYGIWVNTGRISYVLLGDNTTQFQNTPNPQAEANIRFKAILFINMVDFVMKFYTVDVNGYTFVNETNLSTISSGSVFNSESLKIVYNLGGTSSVYKIAVARV